MKRQRPFDPTRHERKLKPIKQPKASVNRDEGELLRWGGSSGEASVVADSANVDVEPVMVPEVGAKVGPLS